MPAPVYSAEDYRSAFQALFPRGWVWPTDPDTVQGRTLLALSQVYARSNLAANNLLVDAFPPTAVAMLPEWEASLGLPDPCAGEAPTIPGRQAQVRARFSNSGGQSPAYYISFAADLGYTITVESFAPFRCGQSACGDGLGGDEWSDAWAITAPIDTIRYFRADESHADEPLEDFGNAVLECELNAIKPAHTILLFQYV